MAASIAAYILVSLLIRSNAYPIEDFYVSKESLQCNQEGNILSCDYSDYPQSIVHTEGLTDSSIKTLVVSNSQKVFISESVCLNLVLNSVDRVELLSLNSSSCDELEMCDKLLCENLIKLSLFNSSLTRIPQSVTEIDIKESVVFVLEHPLLLKKLTSFNSIIEILDLSTNVLNHTILTIHNSTVNVLRSLKLGHSSRVLFQGSNIEQLDYGAIQVNAGQLFLKNCSVKTNILVKDSDIIATKASVILEEFKGDFNFQVLDIDGDFKKVSHPNISFTKDFIDTEESVPASRYFNAYIAFLVLFVLMTILFVLQLIIKQRRHFHGEIHSISLKSRNNYEKRNIPEGTSVQPLIPDCTDKSHEGLDKVVDSFEDDLVKAIEVTRALYMEDLDDIRTEMDAAITGQQEIDFGEFLKENEERLELQEFQMKSGSKMNKKTAMLERMNLAIMELIKEQYRNNTFELKNNNIEIQLKHKERIVECNNRFCEDMVVIIKSTVDKWNDDLYKDEESLDVIKYIRILLLNFLHSTIQVQTRLTRQVLESKEESRATINDLEKSYRDRIDSIDGLARSRLELLHSTEKEDTEVFGSKKASQFSGIQEQCVCTMQTLQQKEAKVELSEDKQKLLLQEKIICFQEESIKHLERITLTLADLRSAYILSKTSLNNVIDDPKAIECEK